MSDDIKYMQDYVTIFNGLTSTLLSKEESTSSNPIIKQYIK